LTYLILYYILITRYESYEVNTLIAS